VDGFATDRWLLYLIWDKETRIFDIPQAGCGCRILSAASGFKHRGNATLGVLIAEMPMQSGEKYPRT